MNCPSTFPPPFNSNLFVVQLPFFKTPIHYPITHHGCSERIQASLPGEPSPRFVQILSSPHLSNPAGAGYVAIVSLISSAIDIQAVGDQALLDKYGLKANDAILAEEKHVPLYEDLLNNYDAKLIAGGAAQNTARGAQ